MVKKFESGHNWLQGANGEHSAWEEIKIPDHYMHTAGKISSHHYRFAHSNSISCKKKNVWMPGICELVVFADLSHCLICCGCIQGATKRSQHEHHLTIVAIANWRNQSE